MDTSYEPEFLRAMVHEDLLKRFENSKWHFILEETMVIEGEEPSSIPHFYWLLGKTGFIRVELEAKEAFIKEKRGEHPVVCSCIYHQNSKRVHLHFKLLGFGSGRTSESYKLEISEGGPKLTKEYN